MDDDREDMGEDDAARAFAQLGREVSLLRSDIEGLPAARESIEIADYQPTLERTEKILVALAQRIDPIAKSPLLSMTTRSEEHTSELQSLMRNSYAVICLKQTNINRTKEQT